MFTVWKGVAGRPEGERLPRQFDDEFQRIWDEGEEASKDLFLAWFCVFPRCNVLLSVAACSLGVNHSLALPRVSFKGESEGLECRTIDHHDSLALVCELVENNAEADVSSSYSLYCLPCAQKEKSAQPCAPY